jgi:oligopeptidase B
MPIPSANRVPVTRELFGEVVVDEFGWLRDRTNPDTIAYLEAENRYTEESSAHLEELRQTIFAEIKARTQETDLTAPAKRDDWWYAAQTEEGRQYPMYVRMHGSPDGPRQILLDANLAAEGHDYLQVGVFSVSPDHRLAAYSIDTDGSENYRLRIRDLATGEDLTEEIPGTYYSAAWSSDGRFLFYTTFDQAHRPDRVWRHEVGSDPISDVVVFHEPDDRMFLAVDMTSDRRFVIISAGSQITADVSYIPADDPTATFRPVLPRVHGVEYSADHRDGRWLIVTNHDAPNGKLISVAVEHPADVTEIIAHDPLRKVSAVRAFARHVAVFGRRNGSTSITILTQFGDAHELEFDEEVFTASPSRNLEYDTSLLRIAYQSLVTPAQIIDVDLDTGARSLVKETPVLGGYDRTAYVSSRVWAEAGDGTRVPISMVHRADVDRSSPSPLLLYGYGSYEATVDPYFSIARLSLLDRGVIFAIAHPRGGGAMGRLWYEDGKLSKKQNTFSDFIAAAETLIDSGYTTPDLLAARGGSAGGLLMGAIANQRPDLFRAIVAEVPFVDVINTMLDDTLPLTVIEWEEWGNPTVEEQYRWMRAYAPYENLRAGEEYPAMLVTAGLNDPRVSYWEPAKWTARMRAEVRHRGPLLLKTEMGAGHGGPSGRYDAWRDEAFILAFLLDQFDKA